jgi:hypothetical protein
MLDDDFYADPIRVEFEVSEVWRGGVGSTAVVTTGFGDGDCGFPFAVGDEYVVPAYANSDGLSTGLCSGVEWLSASGSLSTWQFRYSRLPTRTSLWRAALLRACIIAALILMGCLGAVLMVGHIGVRLPAHASRSASWLAQLNPSR